MAHPDRLLRSHIRARWLVTLDDDQTFDGLLWDADATHLVLVDAETVAANGDRLKIDGQLWVPRINVRYMQAPRA